MREPLPTLDPRTVRDPISRPGWYVLARRTGEQWLVLQSRVSYEHIVTAWANSVGVMDERMLVRVTIGGEALIALKPTV